MKTLALALALATPSFAFCATNYTITDLGTLSSQIDVPTPFPLGQSNYEDDNEDYGGGASFAAGINAAGQIVGNAQSGECESSHAFLFDNDSGALTDLGTMGGRSSLATAINASSQIVGTSSPAKGTWAHARAFLYADGAYTDLGTLGGPNSAATGINDAGQIVGNADLKGGRTQHAFLYADGNMTDLGTLGGASSFATSINAAGQVVGYSEVLTSGIARWRAKARIHAFLYDGGNMTDLSTATGPESYATAINDAGQIVGSFASPDGIHAFVYADGGFTDLGTLPIPIDDPVVFDPNADNEDAAPSEDDAGPRRSARCRPYQVNPESHATAINNAGLAVGDSTFGWEGSRAVIFEDGQVTDLNDLIPADSGWTLVSATGINDDGLIAGTGYSPSGETHAFLLTPDLTPVIVVETPSPTITTQAVLMIRGHAKGSISKVFVKNGKKSGKRPALGTSKWRARVHLKPGKNVITVTAKGPKGSSKPQKLVVTRK